MQDLYLRRGYLTLRRGVELCHTPRKLQHNTHNVKVGHKCSIKYSMCT